MAIIHAPLKPKPAPAPWGYSEQLNGSFEIFNATTNTHALVYPIHGEEARATARLIAEAPELLHVLEILVEQGYYPHGSTLAAAENLIKKVKGS